MKLEIKTIFGELIFEGDFSCISEAINAALAAKKSLSSADLRSADLRSADLSSADLSSANLSSADLRCANLSYANLSYADLSYADLRYANLGYADLRSADLRCANLSYAKNIPEYYYRIVRDDIWAVLSSAPREAEGLRTSIIAGLIDGSVYEGECACLVGTIAKVRGVNYHSLDSLKPDASRASETFFMQIHKGDTPDNSPASNFALRCVDEWLNNMRSAFSVQPT